MKRFKKIQHVQPITGVVPRDRDEGYLTAGRVLPDGRTIDVVSLTYGRARLVISLSPTAVTYENGW